MKLILLTFLLVSTANSLDFAVEELLPLISSVNIASTLRSSAMAAITDIKFSSPVATHVGTVKPLVFLHGMGDSCFNRGMKDITEESGEYMGVYSVCIPTGDDRESDTLNGFFMNMDKNVDVFAEKVRADPNLRDGFNCIGLSQGNNICRGYIQRYNNPTAITHISIHGPLVGVSSLPYCPPTENLCSKINEILAKFAYTPAVQNLLFQANYFREIDFVNSTQYKENSQIGRWNNEVGSIDQSIKINFQKTMRFAMIKAMSDTMVIPNEGEWWGAFDTDYVTVLTMKETAWYQQDLFGLRTADEEGKILFNSTQGNHLDFTEEQLFGWLDLYCL